MPSTDIDFNSEEKPWRMEKALAAAPEAEEQNSASAMPDLRTEDKLHNLSAPKLAKQTPHGREGREREGETPKGVTQ